MVRLSELVIAAVFGISASAACGQAVPAESADGPYKVVKSAKVGGEGGFDYVAADPDRRHLYVVRSGQAGRISAYDMDTLKLAGEIPNVSGGHGVAVDPKTGHAFSSSSPVVMFDSKTLAVIKTIPVEGRPDGIFLEPSTERVYVLSHRAPHVTAINTADGTIAGTFDLGGSPEEGVADGKGHAYICVEDKAQVAVVDCKALKTTAHYDLGAKGGQPAGLSMDPANNVLFVYCRTAKNCLVLDAADGKLLATLPTGSGVDAAEFNPQTMESFCSAGDGKLTVIKETSPTSFAVEQNVTTKSGAKCSTLDSKTGRIYLITAERGAAPAAQAAGQGGERRGGGRRGGGRRGGAMVPGSFTILVVGK
jgi:DNA-binding beta-propeller fold protein YncE